MFSVACVITSIPVRSAVASGPIGWPKPSRQAVSRSSAEMTPSSTSRAASFTNAQIRRVVANPATSRFTTTQVFPAASANFRAVSRASSLVWMPRTSSHRRIIGTGEKKCVPTTRSGWVAAAAISVIGMAEVFVASTVSGAQTSLSLRKTSCFTGRRSKTASTAIAAPAADPISVATVIRDCAASASSALIFSLATKRSSELRIAA
jgi:hypothetical protein